MTEITLTKAQNSQVFTIADGDIAEVKEEAGGCSVVVCKDGSEHHVYDSPFSIRVQLGWRHN